MFFPLLVKIIALGGGFAIAALAFFRGDLLGKIFGIVATGNRGINEIKATYAGMIASSTGYAIYLGNVEAFQLAGFAWMTAGILRVLGTVKYPDRFSLIFGLVELLVGLIIYF